MKSRTCFNFDLLFGDYMARCSDQAKLYYIKLCFFANCGFVSNPLSILDSMGYDKSVLQELLNAGELLKLPDRAEVFITSYFVHNKFSPSAWTHTPYYPYWKGKLWTKQNGVATFKKPEEEEIVPEKQVDEVPQIEEENINTPQEMNFQDYLKKCGVNDIEELTPEQLKEWEDYCDSLPADEEHMPF